MRWLTFLFCGGLGLLIQSTLAPKLEFFSMRFDLILIIVVFFSLYAHPFHSLAGAWLLGTIADLMTIERFGFLAISYLLAAGCVISVRDLLFKYQTSSQFLVTLFVSLLIRFIWLVYRSLKYDGHNITTSNMIADVFGASLITAILAPFVFTLLLSQSRILGLPKRKYTYSG